MTAHAVYAPSAAHRWMNCPGSIAACAALPDEPVVSPYASEGTVAHELVARCLAEGVDALAFLGETWRADGHNFAITEEMCEGAQVFIDLMREHVAKGYALRSETALDLGHLWKGQYGTGDGVLYNGASKHLIVADFKYGRGVIVDVEENPQLLSYGSGAYREFQKKGVDVITLIVVQPRAGNMPMRTWSPSIDRLMAFEREFKKAVEDTLSPVAPLVPGNWCQFCPAAAGCPALRQRALTIARMEFNSVPPLPAEMGSAELGRVLDKINLIEDWIEAVKSEALRRALNGEAIEGHKLVRKNTHRKWVNEQAAADALGMLYELSEDQIWTRKLASPAQVEKLVGKAKKDSLKPLIVHPQGDPTLVPESDRREALPVDAREEFASPLRGQLQESARLLGK